MESSFRMKSQTNLLLVTFFTLFFGIAGFWLNSVFFLPSQIVLQTSEEEIVVGELIPPSLKRVKDYPSELETKTLREIIDLSKGKGEIAQKAKKLKKLVEQQRRLKEKY